MAGVNKAIIIGNLGRDPEVRYLPSGQSVANFSVATSETFNDKSGNRQERTDWHNIVVYGKQAELCGQYLKKGRQVYVEGRISYREYEAKDGSGKRKVTEIVALRVQFLGGRAGGDSMTEYSGHSQRTAAMAEAGAGDDIPPIDDEDIPF